MLSTDKVLNPCGASKCPVLSWLPHSSVTVSGPVQQQGAAGSCGLVGMGGILGILSVCVWVVVWPQSVYCVAVGLILTEELQQLLYKCFILQDFIFVLLYVCLTVFQGFSVHRCGRITCKINNLFHFNWIMSLNDIPRVFWGLFWLVYCSETPDGASPGRIQDAAAAGRLHPDVYRSLTSVSRQAASGSTADGPECISSDVI